MRIIFKIFLFIVSISSFYSLSFASNTDTVKIMEEIENMMFFDKKNLNNEDVYLITNQNENNEFSNKKDSQKLNIMVVNPSQSETTFNHKDEKVAYHMMIVGHYEVALEIYKRILKEDPKNNKVKFSLGTVYHKLNQYQDAKKYYLELLASDFELKNDVIDNLISVLSIESPIETIYFLSKLIIQHPNSHSLLSRLANLYDKVGKSDKSIDFLNQAIALDPDNFEYKMNLAVIYDRNQKYREAYHIYNDLLRNNYIDLSHRISSIKERIEFIKSLM